MNTTYNYDRPFETFELSPKLASMTDLVSIILGTGTKDRPAPLIAKEVAETYFYGQGETSQTQLEDINYMDLTSIPGIGKKKAIQICAAVELGRRLASQFNKRRQANFSDPEKVARYFMEKLRHESQEHLYAAYTNTKNRLLGYKEIGVGNINSAPVDVKEIMKWAIRYKAVGIIILHNHPSGDPEPSKEDGDVTRKVAAAAKLIDCDLLDHIVIGDGVFVSFKERGAV